MIEVLGVVQIIAVVLIFVHHEPFQTILVIPLSELSKISTHEQKLLTWVSHHISHEQLALLELIVDISTIHFIYQ